MATLRELKDLALQSVSKKPNSKFSTQDANEALRNELSILAKDYNSYRRNQLDIFEIMQETIDYIEPKKILSVIGQFAEVRVVPHGTSVTFKQLTGRMRAKQFLTRVGLSGVYETFRLDKISFDVNVNAVGIGAYIDLERFLSSDESLVESMDVIVEAMTESIFGEIQRALAAAAANTQRPAANLVVSNTFEAERMQKLCMTVASYGESAVIFAPEEFIIEMGADAIVPVDAANGIKGEYSPDDISDIRNTGFVRIFRGYPIVRIPQSFTDESNTSTEINPQLAYVFPTGKNKIVKVVLEGNTIIREWNNRDNSMEIQAYKKQGVAILTHHNWGIYQNTGIPQTWVG